MSKLKSNIYQIRTTYEKKSCCFSLFGVYYRCDIKILQRIRFCRRIIYACLRYRFGRQAFSVDNTRTEPNPPCGLGQSQQALARNFKVVV
jgi:hypothetical protein